MQSDILDDVVGHVWPGGDRNVHNAVTKKLKDLGARISARIGKEVTHIIFQRKHNATAEEVAAEDEQLRALFEKANKVGGAEAFAQRPQELHGASTSDKKQMNRV
jgi:hypothetical protein